MSQPQHGSVSFNGDYTAKVQPKLILLNAAYNSKLCVYDGISPCIITAHLVTSDLAANQTSPIETLRTNNSFHTELFRTLCEADSGVFAANMSLLVCAGFLTVLTQADKPEKVSPARRAISGLH